MSMYSHLQILSKWDLGIAGRPGPIIILSLGIDVWSLPENEANAGMSQVSAFGEGMSGGADVVPTAWNVGKLGMVGGIEPNAAAEIRKRGGKERRTESRMGGKGRRGEREGEGKGGEGEKEVKATVSQC